MLEWHARATHHGNQGTWHGGRFLEEWADRRALDGITEVFPHYGKKEIRDSLFATMGLFHWLAVETAEHLHYPYPLATDENLRTYVQTLLQ
jgi:aminoglycoside 6-adenylyltransferase